MEQTEFEKRVDQEKLTAWMNLRNRADRDWDNEAHRREFLREVHPLIRDWHEGLPCHKDLFIRGLVPRLLKDAATDGDGEQIRSDFVDFVKRVKVAGVYIVNGKFRLNLEAQWRIYKKVDSSYNEKSGFEHFHAACLAGHVHIVKRFLELGQDPNCFVPKSGYSPLYLAVKRGHRKVAKLLLRHGADPNLPNKRGRTTLHMICMGKYQIENHLGDRLFRICDKAEMKLQLDGRDKRGRTALEWAVSRLQPRLVDLLLDRGANFEGFVFPIIRFAEGIVLRGAHANFPSKLRMVCGLMMVMERLEARGYVMTRFEAIVVMEIVFLYHDLYEMPDHRVVLLREEFASLARQLPFEPNDHDPGAPGLTFYDLIQLSYAEALTRLTYRDWWKLALRRDLWGRLSVTDGHACVAHLAMKLSRTFFERWGMEWVYQRFNYDFRQPYLRPYLDAMLEHRTNRELWMMLRGLACEAG